MADLSCDVDNVKNIGVTKCNKLPQQPVQIIETNADFRLTAEQAASPSLMKTAFQNAIKAGKASRAYLWPRFTGGENASTEAAYDSTTLSDLLADAGKYAFRFHIAKSLCTHKAMFTHNGTGKRFFILDKEEQLLATEFSDGQFGGLLSSLLNVEKIMWNIDGSTATKTPIYLVLENYKEIDARGALLDGSFVSELFPLTDVQIVLSDVAAGTFTATVTQVCDGTPVSGLVAADFTVLTDAGAAQAPTSVTETPAGSGIYVAPRSGNYTDGTVNLVAASSLSITAYESIGAVDLEIP